MSSSTFVLNKESETVAECFSAHYTNIFLIYLYNEARKYVEKEANVPSLTEGYKTAIAVYNNAMSRDDFVKQTLNGVYAQFMKLDKTIRFREFTHKILSAFYPEDGFSGIIKQEKYMELAISKIIHDVTKQIIYTVPVNHAKNIIDKNTDQKTQNVMQDDFTQIVLELMERNHIEYLTKKKSQYHHPMTDHVMFEKAKSELNKVMSEKAEIEAKYNMLSKQLNELQSVNNDLREKVGNQQGRIRELESQVRINNQIPVHHYTPPIIQQPVQQQPVQQQPAMQQQPAQYISGGVIQTGTMAPQYSMHKPSDNKPKRDYSHLIQNSDSEESETEDDENEKKTNRKELNRIVPDDDGITLDMFTK